MTNEMMRGRDRVNSMHYYRFNKKIKINRFIILLSGIIIISRQRVSSNNYKSC